MSGFLDLVVMIRNFRSAAKARSTADDYYIMISDADDPLLMQPRLYVPALPPDPPILHSYWRMF